MLPIHYQSIPLLERPCGKTVADQWPLSEDQACPPAWGAFLLKLSAPPATLPAPGAPQPEAEPWGDCRSRVAEGRWGSAIALATSVPNPDVKRSLWEAVPELAWTLLRASHPFLAPREALQWLDALGGAWLKLPYAAPFDEEPEAHGALAVTLSRRRVVSLHFEGLAGPKHLQLERLSERGSRPREAQNAGSLFREEATGVQAWVLRESSEGALLWEKVGVFHPMMPAWS